MFDLGWGEIVVIGIVALIAIGPKELPGVLRSIGQMMAKVRRMAAEFQGQFNEALREADIADLKKQADEMASSVSDIAKYDPLAETQKEIEKSLEPVTYGDIELGTPKVAGTETPAPGEGTTDGAQLPEGVLPAIDVPLPPEPAPLTEKDFAIADKAAEELAAHEPAKKSESKA
ncbi:MAG: Sec-independent protein translocase protein TatB [Pseudolabrys sp.]|nr:Sec-independent protein translocase protein TatB [Pseudolabrys sp.]